MGPLPYLSPRLGVPEEISEEWAETMELVSAGLMSGGGTLRSTRGTKAFDFKPVRENSWEAVSFDITQKKVTYQRWVGNGGWIGTAWYAVREGHILLKGLQSDYLLGADGTETPCTGVRMGPMDVSDLKDSMEEEDLSMIW